MPPKRGRASAKTKPPTAPIKTSTNKQLTARKQSNLSSQDASSANGTMLDDASKTDLSTEIGDVPGAPPPKLASPPATPGPSGRKTRAGTGSVIRKNYATDAALSDNIPVTASLRAGRKRKHADTKSVSKASNDLPHGLGTATTQPKTPVAAKGKSGKGSRSKKAKKEITASSNPNTSVAKEELEEVEKENNKAQDYLNSDDPIILARLLPDSTKFTPSKYARNYRHSWDATPFPKFEAPPIEAYHIVNDLLTQHHGKKEAPAAISPPSETFAGCGEAPCIIDALCRTRISANVNGNQTSIVIQNMLKAFGSKNDGTGKGSINWDAVHSSPIEKIAETIRFAGHQNVKSKNIRDILAMIQKENTIRRRALTDPSYAQAMGLDNSSAVQQSAAIALADPAILSFDHMHALTYHQAFSAFIEYPGIGPKTASCVCLYCLQRPSFAVDTHVQRITGWLGWRPEKADENKTFSHLEFLIPDPLKYSLHTLFVVHGKECVRCGSKTHEESPGWEEGCVIDHLVKRVKKIDAVRAKKAMGKLGREAGQTSLPFKIAKKVVGKGKGKESGDVAMGLVEDEERNGDSGEEEEEEEEGE